MIEKFLKAFDYKITSGTEYCWKSYPDARYIDFENEFAEGNIVFSTKDYTIYVAAIDNKKTNQPYRWLNPDWKYEYFNEAESRNINPNVAWDDVEYIDLEDVNDFLEKCHSIFRGLPYDDRIVVPINLSDKEWYTLMKKAHNMDITLNKFIEFSLEKYIDGENLNEEDTIGLES